MARIHGRHGALYVGLANGTASAQPVVNLNKWTIDLTSDQVDVTSFDDSNKVYVAGFADAKGTYGGWYDNSTAQLFTAASDGVARKFYLYPDRTDNTRYWFGTGNFDTHSEGGVGEAVSISGNWSAASSVSPVGIT